MSVNYVQFGADKTLSIISRREDIRVFLCTDVYNIFEVPRAAECHELNRDVSSECCRNPEIISGAHITCLLCCSYKRHIIKRSSK